jgi:hypothetical protein
MRPGYTNFVGATPLLRARLTRCQVSVEIRSRRDAFGAA